MPGAQDRWDQLAEPSTRSQDATAQVDRALAVDVRQGAGDEADLAVQAEALDLESGTPELGTAASPLCQ